MLMNGICVARKQFLLFIGYGDLKIFFIPGNQAKRFFALLTCREVIVGQLDITAPEFFKDSHTVPFS